MPGLALSGIDMGESIKESLELAVTGQAAKGGRAGLAGRALGRGRRGGGAGPLRTGALSRDGGGQWGCRRRRF